MNNLYIDPETGRPTFKWTTAEWGDLEYHYTEINPLDREVLDAFGTTVRLCGSITVENRPPNLAEYVIYLDDQMRGFVRFQRKDNIPPEEN